MRLATIVGARPQFIKAAALSTRIAQQEAIEEIIVHTGQHFDRNMSNIFFEELNIPNPKYNLGVNSLSHGAMTGRMLEKIETILQNEKPDWLLVYGDTNSTLAGALAAQKIHIPVAHVEAGLRSYNEKMPEEINRVLTDRLSSMLFCPTENAKKNMLKEGIADNRIKIVGDILRDSVQLFKRFATPPEFDIPERFILGTLHRQENTDDPQRLDEIINAYNEISASTPIVLPLHPRTRKILNNRSDIQPDKKRIIILPPVSYWNMWPLEYVS
jgi:UDP-GlcNAc3NAcA epimerase